jgi:hypothetical protein
LLWNRDFTSADQGTAAPRRLSTRGTAIESGFWRDGEALGLISSQEALSYPAALPPLMLLYLFRRGAQVHHRPSVSWLANFTHGPENSPEVPEASAHDSTGSSSYVRPFRSRPAAFLFVPPHCLKKNLARCSRHCRRRLWTHSAFIGLAPLPLSPPRSSSESR